MQKEGSLKTYLYRGCPRCQGDLVLDTEAEPNLAPDQGLAYVCLQCGRRTTLEKVSMVKAPAAARAA
jgi:DNA-directed RNA polymerase subunit RPC12/RpoP